jgi:CBS domain-containing protein
VLIEHILHRKGREVETISAAALVSDAAVLLHDRNIGALVVMADEDAEGGVAVAGILSERDVVRALGESGADSAAVLASPWPPS